VRVTGIWIVEAHAPVIKITGNWRGWCVVMSGAFLEKGWERCEEQQEQKITALRVAPWMLVEGVLLAVDRVVCESDLRRWNRRDN
jgi:hypothetical protein